MTKTIFLLLFTLCIKFSNGQIDGLRNKTFKVIQTDKSHPQFKDAYFIFKKTDTLIVKKGDEFYNCSYGDTGTGYLEMYTGLPYNDKGGKISSNDMFVVKTLKKNLVSLSDSIILKKVDKIK